MNRKNTCGFSVLLALFAIWLSSPALAQNVDKAWVLNNYAKQEQMVTMRDGIQLYTAIYVPKGVKNAPLLVTRTPYGCAYGDDFDGKMWGAWKNYAREGYIFVFQDVRGKWRSQGDYVDIRPFIANKKGKKQIDEASDFYDTADWLLKNVKGNNGRIGVLGNSYSGFYTAMAVLSRHPALKAAVPQAPVVNWFRGDDWHHNGALFLRNAFSFFNGHGRVRPSWTSAEPAAQNFFHGDEYSYFLGLGALKNVSALFKGELPFWNDMMAHPNEDAWWTARNYLPYCKGLKTPVMVVGGLFDAEDNYGANQLYQALCHQSPDADIRFVYGPWRHGGWMGDDGGHLGHVWFSGANTTVKYRDEMEFAFLQHYLKDANVPLPAEKVQVFVSGENKWHGLTEWPAKTSPKTFYLGAGNTLNQTAPKEESSYSQYVSDPAHPVPFNQATENGSSATWMTADQRFAAQRPDVLMFRSEPLEQPLTLEGEVEVNLWVSLTTTDADFVVKVLDIFPDDFKYGKEMGTTDGYMMGGYQMPIRMDVMRGRYRNSYSCPEPYEVGKPTLVKIRMQSVAHTLLKGHRLGLQIQSTWFPLVDRNPQQFIPVSECSNADFRTTEVRVFHQVGAVSEVVVGN